MLQLCSCVVSRKYSEKCLGDEINWAERIFEGAEVTAVQHKKWEINTRSDMMLQAQIKLTDVQIPRIITQFNFFYLFLLLLVK